jgi:hypothetical protein
MNVYPRPVRSCMEDFVTDVGDYEIRDEKHGEQKTILPDFGPSLGVEELLPPSLRTTDKTIKPSESALCQPVQEHACIDQGRQELDSPRAL